MDTDKRFYWKAAPENDGTYNVYDRSRPYPQNHTGHACIMTALDREAAERLAAFNNGDPDPDFEPDDWSDPAVNRMDGGQGYAA